MTVIHTTDGGSYIEDNYIAAYVEAVTNNRMVPVKKPQTGASDTSHSVPSGSQSKVERKPTF